MNLTDETALRDGSMNLADFEYDLPKSLIAAHPPAERGDSRLMALGRATGAPGHGQFGDLLGYLRPGDCLVVNDSRVIPARLFGKRSGGGRAQIFLIEPIDSSGATGPDPHRWKALVLPGRKLRPGSRIVLTPRAGQEAPEVTVYIQAELPGGGREIRFETDLAIEEILERFGHIPLPPYILAARREELTDGPRDEALDAAEDMERYQTVYAKAAGSVAAPTAGLHFTSDLLGRIEASGVELRRVTLHVGPGTFEPVKADRPEDHRMHSERYEISSEDAEAIEAARADPKRRIVAVGTTVMRTLEACMARAGKIVAGPATTDILIFPGFDFRAVDAMITNFHLPRSTLLMLVAAFAGTDRVRDAYTEAVRREYRFYSYGDAMFIG